MPSYLEMSLANRVVRIEIDPSGTDVRRGQDLSALLIGVAELVSAAASTFRQNIRGARAEIEFGIRAASDNVPVVVLDRSVANFQVRLTLDAVDIEAMLSQVSQAKPKP